VNTMLSGVPVSADILLRCTPVRGEEKESRRGGLLSAQRRQVNEGAIVDSRRPTLEEVDEFERPIGSTPSGLDSLPPYVISAPSLLAICVLI
jgi:hypothetical protein